MARLLPGFRFDPSDVVLIMYYLKRKIMGKKLHCDVITELNIYKFSPWDLPEKCCYKSKDLEWYFFCPRERKYASGARMNRATETGFWKTTGKDRVVKHEEKVVGSVRTLVFHLGHPPRGQRTDWVIHEYKFIDIGSVQDTYVLCKVFQKSGPGPKNGAYYGAPFKEEDWDDDNVPEPCTSDIVSALPVLPEKRSYSIVTSQLDHGSTSHWPSSEPSRPFTQRMPLDEPDDEEVPGEPNPSNVSSMHRIPLDEPDDGEFPGELNPSNVSSINWMPLNKPDDEAVLGGSNTSNILSALPVLPDRQSCSIGTSMINPCPGLSSALLCTNEMPIDEQDDEILRLLDRFTDDPPMLSARNENNQDGNDIFDGLGDINSWTGLGQSRSNLFASEGPNYSLNPTILPEDAAYMELNDLETPLDHSAETIETEQLGLGNFGAPYNSNIDMQHLCFGSNFLGTDHVLDYQLPMLPESYVPQVHHSDMVYNFQNNVNLCYNGATNFNVHSSEQPEGSRLAAQSLERGVQQRKFYSSSFALPVSAIEHLSTAGSICGGSFILVKAEVTPGIGGCTNEALSTILGGSWCVFTCQPNIYKADCLKEEYKAFCFGFILAFICFSHLNRLWFHTLWALYDLSSQRYIQTYLELIQVSFCLHNC